MYSLNNLFFHVFSTFLIFFGCFWILFRKQSNKNTKEIQKCGENIKNEENNKVLQLIFGLSLGLCVYSLNNFVFFCLFYVFSAFFIFFVFFCFFLCFLKVKTKQTNQLINEINNTKKLEKTEKITKVLQPIVGLCLCVYSLNNLVFFGFFVFLCFLKNCFFFLFHFFWTGFVFFSLTMPSCFVYVFVYHQTIYLIFL